MASSVDLLKTLMSDKGTPPLLTDLDYISIVELEDNAYRAAATAARAIAASFSNQADMGGGSSKMALSQLSENYLDLADSYDKRAATGGDGGTGMAGIVAGGTPEFTGVSVSDIDSVNEDTDRYDNVFIRGNMDNPSGVDDND